MYIVQKQMNLMEVYSYCALLCNYYYRKCRYLSYVNNYTGYNNLFLWHINATCILLKVICINFYLFNCVYIFF